MIIIFFSFSSLNCSFQKQSYCLWRDTILSHNLWLFPVKCQIAIPSTSSKQETVCYVKISKLTFVMKWIFFCQTWINCLKWVNSEFKNG